MSLRMRAAIVWLDWTLTLIFLTTAFRTPDVLPSLFFILIALVFYADAERHRDIPREEGERHG